MEIVKVKTEARYVSHDVKSNKAINITFKMPYSELTRYIQTIQMLNENILVGCKIGASKPIKLGTFMLQNLNIDRDGEGKLKLNSQLDFVEMDNVNELAMRNDEPIFLLLKAEVDLEEAEEVEEVEEE